MGFAFLVPGPQLLKAFGQGSMSTNWVGILEHSFCANVIFFVFIYLFWRGEQEWQ